MHYRRTPEDEFTEVTKGPNGEPGVVIVHVEACTHLHRALGKIREAGGSPSVALNPHTPAEMIENVMDMVRVATGVARNRPTL